MCGLSPTADASCMNFVSLGDWTFTLLFVHEDAGRQNCCNSLPKFPLFSNCLAYSMNYIYGRNSTDAGNKFICC